MAGRVLVGSGDDLLRHLHLGLVAGSVEHHDIDAAVVERVLLAPSGSQERGVVRRIQRQMEASVGVQMHELRVPARWHEVNVLIRCGFLEEHRPSAGRGDLAAARYHARQSGGHPLPQVLLDLGRAGLGELQVRDVGPGHGPVALTSGENGERHGDASFASSGP
ncbi:hypothetical protein SGFS_028100 [Streptomyces graminofaciens]|uniref:Uncharacterized protein n=1 Tax=Streptomyces graminofaciens TaxID=68212 RepID=A0ABM7F4M2_9ACTN|nr:hypothetical protein SGFS_028100 [Streptomyces graminofaciens]